MAEKEIKQLDVTMLSDGIIVEPIKITDEIRESGIMIPEYLRQKDVNLPRFGYIRAAGPGRDDKGMTVKVGDQVAFMFHSGTPFEFNGTTHLIMREFDVTMIINKRKK